MIRLKRVTEAKQVGTIYHVCDDKATIYNLKNNSITPGNNSNVHNGYLTVSFTRDKGYIVDTIGRHEIFAIQFVLDGDKLSEKYEIHPYSAIGYGNSEKEEIVVGAIKDLKKYLKKINVLFNVNAANMNLNNGNYDITQRYIECLDAIIHFGVPYSLEYVRISDLRDREVPIKEVSNLPHSLEDLLALFKQIKSYNADAVLEACYNICKTVFTPLDFNVRKYHGNEGRAIDVTAADNKPSPSLPDVKKPMLVLVDTIREELGVDKIVVTEGNYSSLVAHAKAKRHSTHKLETILSNRTYKLDNLEIHPYVDYLYNKTPRVDITVINSKYTALYFHVYFPL